MTFLTVTYVTKFARCTQVYTVIIFYKLVLFCRFVKLLYMWTFSRINIVIAGPDISYIDRADRSADKIFLKLVNSRIVRTLHLMSVTVFKEYNIMIVILKDKSPKRNHWHWQCQVLESSHFQSAFFMTSHTCMCSLHTYCYIIQAQISQKDHDYLKHLKYVFMY